MAQKTPTHLEYHLNKTWDYVSGSGSETSQWGYSTMNDGLPHDVLHVVYYGTVYGVGTWMAIMAIGFFIALISSFSER